MGGPTDVAILSQSPWLRGGFRSQAEAFWNGTLQLGREPHLFYISGGGRSLSLVRRTARVTAAREEHAPLVGTAYPAFFPEVDSINQLANEEHELFQKEARGEASDADRARLKDLQVSLDRCWDLLHQRRARRAAGQNPDEAEVRPESVVEGYVN